MGGDLVGITTRKAILYFSRLLGLVEMFADTRIFKILQGSLICWQIESLDIGQIYFMIGQVVWAELILFNTRKHIIQEGWITVGSQTTERDAKPLLAVSLFRFCEEIKLMVTILQYLVESKCHFIRVWLSVAKFRLVNPSDLVWSQTFWVVFL